MSSEEPFASEGHKTDEQVAIEQEQQDEEREISFAFQKEGRASASVAPVDAVEGETGPSGSTTAAVEEGEAAAVEEALGVAPARSGRKSRSSGDAETERKRARRSEAVESENVRLDRLRQALYRFLDLIEHRATASSFAKALPHIEVESVEALRMQFVGQLKQAIIDESEKLIESNELEAKLASLHRLTQEADARFHAGYPDNADELKDVWRKDLDLETAISARAIPDQQSRIEQLKHELDQVRQQNNQLYAQMQQTRASADAIQSDAKDTLDALDSAIKGLEATPEMQKQLRQTMDDLLLDLGARV